MRRHPVIAELRRHYHCAICSHLLGRRREGILSCADRGSVLSTELSESIAGHMDLPLCEVVPHGQTLGKLFTNATLAFLRDSFMALQHIRPGDWGFQAEASITQFDQYEHLALLDSLLLEHSEARAALGSDYLITPDIVVFRAPLRDEEINAKQQLVGDAGVAAKTPLRGANADGHRPILHASVSCKWTIRSDRVQNTRTEALNLVRNRKGATPRIAAVTMEPLPSRLSSIALGTGDIDCTYHAAFHELEQAVDECGNEEAVEMLRILIEGRRLRDISDLPFDLAT